MRSFFPVSSLPSSKSAVPPQLTLLMIQKLCKQRDAEYLSFSPIIQNINPSRLLNQPESYYLFGILTIQPHFYEAYPSPLPLYQGISLCCLTADMYMNNHKGFFCCFFLSESQPLFKRYANNMQPPSSFTITVVLLFDLHFIYLGLFFHLIIVGASFTFKILLSDQTHTLLMIVTPQLYAYI